MSPIRNIVVYNPSRFSNEVWLPALWAQSKTYYELHGQKTNQWRWVPCYADLHCDDINSTKEIISTNPPDVFAISLYVWNTNVAHEVAKWVKEEWPNCIVISGGPHQYFNHDQNWFARNWWLDASLPGDCFGEPFIASILDNYDDLRWSDIPDARYPIGKSRLVATSTKRANRDEFDFSWAAFSQQSSHIEDFIQYKTHRSPSALLLSILETTRGCPYGCSYCDWGGGINTKIKSKPVEIVKADIDALSDLPLSYVYLADANFGILKNRDVEIIEYIAETRLKTNNHFSLGYGGFAKTENRTDYIKKILSIDLKHGLSNFGEIKISLQSMNPTVLKNINRVNIPIEKQLGMAKSLVSNRVPVYAELILGLPGTTIGSFYEDLNVLGNYEISAIWYEWILLPEAPAYDFHYRKKHEIQIIEKRSGWYVPTNATNKLEIVVAGTGFTTSDYLEMLLSSSLFKCIIQGGVYRKTIEQISRNRSIGFGDICKDIYHNFFSTQCKNIKDAVVDEWHNSILIDIDRPCYVDIQDHSVFCGLYFVALCFLCPNKFTYPLGDWLVNRYQCSHRIMDQERASIITQSTLNKKIRHGIWVTRYKKDNVTNFDSLIKSFMQFKNTGNALLGTKKVI